MAVLGRRRQAVAVAILGVCVVAGLGRPAAGHANPVDSFPAPGASLADGPAEVWMAFSEPLVPSFSRLELLDSAGRVVAEGPAFEGAPPSAMRLPLPPLEPGVYRVRWQTLSPVDGHVRGGSYPFFIGMAAAEEPKAEAPASPLESAAVFLAEVALRWLTLTGYFTWVGMAAFCALVDPGRWHGARRWVFAGMAVLALGRLTEVLFPLAVAVAGQGWPALAGLWEAAFGSPFARGSWALLTWTGGSAVLLGRVRAQPAWTSAVAGAVGGLALAATGHAAQVQGLYLSSVLAAWLHLVAAAVWAGGVFAVALLLLPGRGVESSGPRLEDLVSVVRRFSPVAVACVAVLAVTGAFRADLHVPAGEGLGESEYGVALLLKLIVVLLVLALATSHALVIRPQLARELAGPRREGVLWSLGSTWRRLMRFEALGMLTLGAVVAMLAVTPLPVGGGPAAGTVPAPGGEFGLPAGAGDFSDLDPVELVQRATAAMNGLTSVRVRTYPAGRPRQFTDTVLQAPDRMHQVRFDGQETVVSARVVLYRPGPGRDWEAGLFHPFWWYRWPEYDWATYASQARVVGRQQARGKDLVVVALVHRASQLQYRLWIDTATYRVHREETLFAGQHLVHEYSDFNAPVSIAMPLDLPHW